nr:hypothetical protein [Acetobacter persici]
MKIRLIVSFLALVVLALPLSGCGKKGSPTRRGHRIKSRIRRPIRQQTDHSPSRQLLPATPSRHPCPRHSGVAGWVAIWQSHGINWRHKLAGYQTIFLF